MKVICVVGARPNFMKVAPLVKQFNLNSKFESLIVHTGQHYDKNMNDVFIGKLLPYPKYFLGINKGSTIEQISEIMLQFEKIVTIEKPNLILVVGDVNSTLACSIVANKLNVKLAHVEAGLRSFDRNMPEEINRIITDHLSDYLFVTENSGISNLHNESIDSDKVFFVGNVMIDSLIENSQNIKLEDDKKYILVTMHRPSNVDNSFGLTKIIEMLDEIKNKNINIIFPIHPRTKKNFEKFGLLNELVSNSNLVLLEPQDYNSFLTLIKNSTCVLTDSGGIQEETTFFQIPCITFRENTERPITTEVGTNTLVSDLSIERVMDIIDQIINNTYKKGQIPELWDGKASKRIVEILNEKV